MGVHAHACMHIACIRHAHAWAYRRVGNAYDMHMRVHTYALAHATYTCMCIPTLTAMHVHTYAYGMHVYVHTYAFGNAYAYLRLRQCTCIPTLLAAQLTDADELAVSSHAEIAQLRSRLEEMESRHAEMISLQDEAVRFTFQCIEDVRMCM